MESLVQTVGSINKVEEKGGHEGKRDGKEKREYKCMSMKYIDLFLRFKRGLRMKMHWQSISCSAGIQIVHRLLNNMPKDFAFSSIFPFEVNRNVCNFSITLILSQYQPTHKSQSSVMGLLYQLNAMNKIPQTFILALSISTGLTDTSLFNSPALICIQE